MSCQSFVQLRCLDTLAGKVHPEHGVVIVNMSCQDPLVYAHVVENLKKAFGAVIEMKPDLEDVNRVLFVLKNAQQ